MSNARKDEIKVFIILVGATIVGSIMGNIISDSIKLNMTINTIVKECQEK